jgi:hypothetical protein
MSPTAEYWITTTIATVALLLSVLNLYLQWKEKKPLLKVAATVTTKEFPVLPDSTGQSPPTKEFRVLSVYLSNPSEKAIHVRAINLVPSFGSQIELKEYNALYVAVFTPFAIESYRGREFIVRGQWLAEELQKHGHSSNVRCIVEVNDDVGKQYKSKPIRFTVNQLLAA